jgi:cell division septal protein FtsQ
MWTVRATAAVLVIAVAAIAWPVVSAAVERHPYFAVREVVVRGNRRLAATEVRAVAAIEPGISIWRVDGERAQDQLRQLPWVHSARVRRQLPHRVLIQVREERPMAILAAADAAAPHLYLAAPGRLVAAVGPADPCDLPYVTGLAVGDLRGGDAFVPRAIRQALVLIRLAGRLGAVSEVNIDRRRGLTLLPVRPAVPIELGWGRYPQKLERLPPVVARWAGREAEIEGINLMFDDQAIVRRRAAGGSSRPHHGTGA